MQLDDLIKQERVGNITRQTHISAPVLERLLSREFHLLKKPQVLGVVSILEREYGVKLSELREETNEYYRENETNDNGFVVPKSAQRNSNFLAKFFVLLLIMSVVYGGWYFFSAYYKSTSHHLEPENRKTLIDIILEGKDTIIEKVSGESGEVENKSQEIVVESPAESTPLEDEHKSLVVESPVVPKDATKESDLIAPKVSVKPQGSIPIDRNGSNMAPVDHKNQESKRSRDEKIDIARIERSKITLLPQKTMLFNLVNLDTKKVLKFKRKEQYDIDVKDSRWLFNSKDTVFAFIDNDIFEEYGGEGQTFFRLDKDGIHPLTEDEYQRALK